MALLLTQRLQDGPVHLLDKTTGEHIEIKLLDIRGRQVKYAISASDNIEILRDKLYLEGGNEGI